MSCIDAKDYVDLTNQTLTNCSSELELGSCLNEELQVSNCSSNDSDSAYLTGDALGRENDEFMCACTSKSH